MINKKAKKKQITLTQHTTELKTQDVGGSCGPWYIKIQGGHTYTCRVCHTGGPTGFPYEECIQLPD